MPVSASTVQFSYVGDGVTTTFPFPSRFLTAADLLVGVNGAQIVSGFTVTGAGNDAGGNVVFSVAPVNGAAITLIRAPAISQLLDFVNNQTVLAENIDNSLDKLTIVSQYLSYLLDRTLKLSQFDTGLTGNYDLMTKRLTNMAAPVDANDAARLADVQNIVSTTGNVPSPTGGQIGFVLKAISAGVFGWIAAGSPTAPDGSLAAPGYSFANELSTGFLRPSAGVLQAAILGVLKAELTAAQFRLLVPLVQSMATAVTAGTNAQGQGPLTNVLNVVTTTAANPSGVTLPTPVAGQSIRVVNRGTNPINLYPAAGGTIGALAINTPLSLPVGVMVDLFARTTTQWEGYAPQALNTNLTDLAAPTYVRGDLIRRGATTLERLALGTFGQVLVSDGVDAKWQTGSPILLATKTASASASLSFTEFNNAVFSSYRFEFDDILPATNAVGFFVRFSTNGGSSYDAGATDYNSVMEDYSTAGNAGAAGNLSAIEIVRGSAASNTSGSGGIVGDARLVNAGNGAKRTKIYGLLGYLTSTPQLAVGRFYGHRVALQDTDAVQFLFSSGNIASGTIRMYGIV